MLVPYVEVMKVGINTFPGCLPWNAIATVLWNVCGRNDGVFYAAAKARDVNDTLEGYFDGFLRAEAFCGAGHCPTCANWIRFSFVPAFNNCEGWRCSPCLMTLAHLTV
ncbi:hypothetical protein OG21DRAFT_134830 [Imleria badia]|nr:hypothetical protein OG21DRAFT_134830 [Imleria badia]